MALMHRVRPKKSGAAKRIWIAILLVTGIGAAYTGLSSLTFLRKPVATTPSIQSTKPVPVRKGNINGNAIAVPSNYLKFAFDYKDKSIWEPRKPGDKAYADRDYSDALQAIALYIRWPDLLPRSPATEASYQESRKGWDEYSWISIAVTAYNKDAVGRDLGWGPVIEGIMTRLESRPHTRHLPPRNEKERWGGYEEVWLKYVYRGTDANGLKWAEPVGLGSDLFHTWNMALYWTGDKAGYAGDLIECYNGKMGHPTQYQECHHNFNLPEWGASVTVSYPRSWLPDWRVLKEKSKALVLSFQVPASTVIQHKQPTAEVSKGV